MRLVVEKVRVTGWRVEIHLKIPLINDGPDDNSPPEPAPRPDRQAISACVPFVTLKGDSYRLKDRDLGRVSPVEN